MQFPPGLLEASTRTGTKGHITGRVRSQKVPRLKHVACARRRVNTDCGSARISLVAKGERQSASRQHDNPSGLHHVRHGRRGEEAEEQHSHRLGTSRRTDAAVHRLCRSTWWTMIAGDGQQRDMKARRRRKGRLRTVRRPRHSHRHPTPSGTTSPSPPGGASQRRRRRDRRTSRAPRAAPCAPTRRPSRSEKGA